MSLNNIRIKKLLSFKLAHHCFGYIYIQFKFSIHYYLFMSYVVVKECMQCYEVILEHVFWFVHMNAVITAWFL